MKIEDLSSYNAAIKAISANTKDSGVLKVKCELTLEQWNELFNVIPNDSIISSVEIDGSKTRQGHIKLYSSEQDSALSQFAAAVTSKKLTSLVGITLDHVIVDEVITMELFNIVLSSPYLVRLELKNCDMSDKSSASIINACLVASNLAMLNLAGNELTDESIPKLITLLNNEKSSLNWLCVNGKVFNHAKEKDLREALDKNRTLAELKVEDEILSPKVNHHLSALSRSRHNSGSPLKISTDSPRTPDFNPDLAEARVVMGVGLNLFLERKYVVALPLLTHAFAAFQKANKVRHNDILNQLGGKIFVCATQAGELACDIAIAREYTEYARQFLQDDCIHVDDADTLNTTLDPNRDAPINDILAELEDLEAQAEAGDMERDRERYNAEQNKPDKDDPIALAEALLAKIERQEKLDAKVNKRLSFSSEPASSPESKRLTPSPNENKKRNSSSTSRIAKATGAKRRKSTVADDVHAARTSAMHDRRRSDALARRAELECEQARRTPRGRTPLNRKLR